LERRMSNVRILVEAGISSSGPILEVGCGTGAMAAALAATFPGSKVVGLDIEKESIDYARARNSAPNLEYRVGDAHDLSQYRGTQGMVVFQASFHHFGDIRVALEQAYQALVPEGMLFGIDLNRDALVSPSPEGDRIGDFLALAEMIYRIRSAESDSAYVDFLESQGDLSSGDAIMILSMLSYMAAYTPEEVEAAMQGIGFAEFFVIPYGEYDSDLILVAKK
jgi:ubiquinone/menaquinone biosynthesis C-methylase UbiE